MTYIEGPDVIAGYDLDTARNLLGVADYQPGQETGLIDCICNFICAIWIMMQRMFTFIFGDRHGSHCWYNNQAAASLLERYCDGSEYRIGTYVKVKAIYQSLKFRQAPSPCFENSHSSFAEMLGPRIAAIFPE